MKALSPVQSLVLLILVGLMIGGWCYGLHWKRVASGDLFSPDEMMTVRLQDQIKALSEENAVLHEKLDAVTGEPAAGPAPNPTDLDDPGKPVETLTLPSTGPSLPARPQKIETH